MTLLIAVLPLGLVVGLVAGGLQRTVLRSGFEIDVSGGASSAPWQS